MGVYLSVDKGIALGIKRESLAEVLFATIDIVLEQVDFDKYPS